MAKDKYLLSSPFTILSMSTTLTFGISSFQNLLSFSFSHFLNRLICFPHHEFIKFLIKIYLTQYQIVLMVGLDLRIISLIFENFLERRPDKNFDRVFCVEENCPFRSLERKPWYMRSHQVRGYRRRQPTGTISWKAFLPNHGYEGNYGRFCGERSPKFLTVTVTAWLDRTVTPYNR